MKRLQQAGITFKDESESIADIAKRNNLTPQQLYEIMKPEEKKDAAGKKLLRENPPPGFGNRSLADICHEYDFNIKIILRGLADKGIQAKEELNIKTIAEQNSTSPMDIFELIKEIAEQNEI